MRWPITANALSPYLCAMGENRARRLNSSTSTAYPRGMEASVLAETRKKSLCSKKGIRLFSRKQNTMLHKNKTTGENSKDSTPAIHCGKRHPNRRSVACTLFRLAYSCFDALGDRLRRSHAESEPKTERGVADLEGTCSRCFWWKCFFNSRSSSSSFVAILKTANSTGPAWESWVATTPSMQDLYLQCGSA